MSEAIENKEGGMPLGEHLKELRRRVIISLLALFVAFVLCYLVSEHIYNFLVAPLADAFGEGSDRRLIYTGLTEAFFTYIKVSFFAGFFLAFPVIASQFYFFLAPGLYKKEKKVVIPYLVASPVLFFAGAAMVYYFIFPLAWQFFITFEHGGGEGTLPIQLEARVSEYLALVMQLMFAFGFAFQLPIILTLLARAGFVTSEGLAKKRKYALVAIVIAAAIMTPPDIISQIGLAIAMMLLYECSRIACKWVEEKKDE